MPREKECFRDMLERLNTVYPDKEFLKATEVASFIGCSRRTVDRKFKEYYKHPFGISKVQLAKLLS